MERALVTGITGFIGSHLARALVADGVEVHALVREQARLDRVADLLPRVTVRVVDGSAEGAAEAVAAARPDVAFHLATHFVGEHGVGDVDSMVESNVAFPARLADALASSGSTRLVNAGTAWQHVDGERYRPKNFYAATKQAFEDLLRYYQDRDLLRVVTLNLFDTYGPRDHRGKLVSSLIAALRTGEPLAMGSGRQLIDLVHVDDVVRAFLAASDLDANGPGFAISSGRPRSVREVVEVLGEVAGRPVPVRWGARPDRPGEMHAPWDAGPPPGSWVPSVALEDGLAALLGESADTVT